MFSFLLPSRIDTTNAKNTSKQMAGSMTEHIRMRHDSETTLHLNKISSSKSNPYYHSKSSVIIPVSASLEFRKNV